MAFNYYVVACIVSNQTQYLANDFHFVYHKKLACSLLNYESIELDYLSYYSNSKYFIEHPDRVNMFPFILHKSI